MNRDDEILTSPLPGLQVEFAIRKEDLPPLVEMMFGGARRFGWWHRFLWWLGFRPLRHRHTCTVVLSKRDIPDPRMLDDLLYGQYW